MSRGCRLYGNSISAANPLKPLFNLLREVLARLTLSFFHVGNVASAASDLGGSLLKCQTNINASRHEPFGQGFILSIDFA